MIRQTSKFRRSSDRGAVAVEFAIIAPLFLLLLLSAIDFGRAYYVKEALLNGAGQAARLAAMGVTTQSVLEDAARAAAPGAPNIAYSSTPVSLEMLPANNARCTSTSPAVATASLDFTWVTPLQWIRGTSSAGNSTKLSATVTWKCVNS